MEWTWHFALAITSLGIYFLWFFVLGTEKNHKHSPPPSPPSLPVIGHLHLLSHKQPFHRSLHELSIKYGPIYYLKLGRIPVAVVSSSTLVEECLARNDIVLANRPRNLSAKHLHYDSTTLGAAPYGPLWRDLRRITYLEFFSSKRLNSLRHVREEETKALVKGLLDNSENNERFVQVQVRSKLFECIFNIIMRMLTGKRYMLEGADKVLHEILKEFFELSGASNPIDFFPFLRWFNYGNIEGKMLAVKGKIDAFLDGVIEECKTLRKDDSYRKTGDKTPMIYKLLDLQETDPKQYSDQSIRGIILILLLGGIDTSVIEIEWALASLLNNKSILDKARSEVDNNIGSDRLVNESDLDKLHFIHCIIDETLRLFPAGPLLIPRESSEDCTIARYHIPKGTMVLFNAWAVHRDPNLWDDPIIIKPQRFEGVVDVNEYRSSLIPFGIGRRSCPGAALAKRLMPLILSTLLQCFDWENVDGVNVELMEGFGLTMPMDTPLIAMCKPRRGMINFFSTP